jgi:hypothetical protein
MENWFNSPWKIAILRESTCSFMKAQASKHCLGPE